MKPVLNALSLRGPYGRIDFVATASKSGDQQMGMARHICRASARPAEGRIGSGCDNDK
jgi:hypothetical protein